MKTKIIHGKKGESIAADYLEQQGLTIIERNWRFSRVGEIDIIACEGKTLVFIEVKARSSSQFGHPLEAVNPKKLNTIFKLAEIYMNKHQGAKYQDFRIDVIGILMKNPLEISHIKNVYQ